jgi:hypothetical protein
VIPNNGIENSDFGPAGPPPSEDDFYSSAAARIPWFMAGLALGLTAAAWSKFGRAPALGFLAGAVISFFNFHWLKTGVSGLADRATNTGKAQSGKGIVARFLLRYALMGAAAYVILTSFPASLRGLFVGLFLPVGAIACEAAYEAYVALVRKN